MEGYNICLSSRYWKLKPIGFDDLYLLFGGSFLVPEGCGKLFIRLHLGSAGRANLKVVFIESHYNIHLLAPSIDSLNKSRQRRSNVKTLNDENKDGQKVGKKKKIIVELRVNVK